MWAKTLGGESAVKLLQRFAILEQGIDFACESYQVWSLTQLHSVSFLQSRIVMIKSV